jgi:hypothetical protein
MGMQKTRIVLIVSVQLTNVPSIQMALTRGEIAIKTLSIKTKNSLQRVPKGQNIHAQANLMDIEPAEKATNRAPSLLAAINESELSGDELNAYMLDSFNKTLGCPSNNLANLLAKKTKAANKPTGTSFDSIQALVSLEESITHHLDKMCSEFLTVFTHYIDDLYSTRDCDMKLDSSKHETQSLRL